MRNAFKQGRNGVLALSVAVLAAGPLPAAQTPFADVIDLGELNLPPLHLQVVHRGPLTRTRDPNSMIAYLTPGQRVEVVGLGEGQDYVKGRVATGPVQGWVSADALEPPPTEYMARLRDRRAKAEAHRDLIEHHEVAAGMTRAEVRASLGKPDRIVRTRGQHGDEEQWCYVKYRYQPRYWREYDGRGEVRQVVSYQREQAGRRIITFRGDEAVDLVDAQEDKP